MNREATAEYFIENVENIQPGFFEHLDDGAKSIEELSLACGTPEGKPKRLVCFLAAEEIDFISANGKVEYTSRSRSLPIIRPLIYCTVTGLKAGFSLDRITNNPDGQSIVEAIEA